MAKQKPLYPLVIAILVNYLAQIPYYLHQYYFPRHFAPSLLGVVLLTITLAWFIAGYVRYLQNKRYGWGLLLSFLLAQVLFYGHSIVLGLFTGGGIVAQMETPSRFLLVIFLIGYINFTVAAYYLVRFLRRKGDTGTA